MTGKLSKNFHGVAIGPLSKILAVKTGHSVDLFKNIVLIYFVNVGALQTILCYHKRPNFSMSKKKICERTDDRTANWILTD